MGPASISAVDPAVIVWGVLCFGIRAAISAFQSAPRLAELGGMGRSLRRQSEANHSRATAKLSVAWRSSLPIWVTLTSPR